jgi:hypothetical protein
MLEIAFWGENGEYGPFSKHEDGWPNAGEVVRYYRRKMSINAEDLSKQYSKAIGVQVTKRWIFKMEQQNEVPTDITRRRALIKILEIPPFLLGLASFNQVTPKPKAEIQTPAILTYTSLDLEQHSKETRILWKLHYAQTAQDELPNLQTYIHDLAPHQQTAKGDLKQNISELMNSYNRLAATIQRDLGNFEEAYDFANESVRLAMEANKTYTPQIIAASQYTRGVVNLAWGAFGNEAKQGNVSLYKTKIEAAYLDFEYALKNASPQLKGIIYSEMARAKALASNSPTDIAIALKLIELAEPFVNVDSKNEFYTQIILNGDVKGLDKRRLILGRAKTFLAIRRPAKAIEELDNLERLKEGSTHTRRRAWTYILYAQASLDLGDYFTATNKAISAFSDCREVNAVAHLARIQEIYTKLLASPYKDNAEVKQLGKLLSSLFPRKR